VIAGGMAWRYLAHFELTKQESAGVGIILQAVLGVGD